MYPEHIPASLVKTASELRSRALQAYVEEACRLIEINEPSIHALLPETERQVRLLQEAETLQERYPDVASRPPLYGILFGVKDILSVNGFPTRAGSLLPPELFEGREASCVTRLRSAGALVLGKTVTTEFAYFEPGPTSNPHNVRHTPGGSSSGSAAAVAVGYCPLALGTQTIGSVIRPAAFCGIVGFKPSYGRIPNDGLILCSPSLDTIGFFTQDVQGVSLAASILCDEWRVEAPPSRLPVLGVPHSNYLAQASEEGRAAFEAHIRMLAQSGYTVKRVDALHDIEAIRQRHTTIIAAEMSAMHAEWFARYESLYRPRTAALIREGQQVRSETLESARAGRAALRHELEGYMDAHGIDLWISPAAPGPAPEGLTSTGNPIMNLPWTHAGLPALAIPAGRAANGLPLGLQVVGRFMQDERLVAWGEIMADVFAA